MLDAFSWIARESGFRFLAKRKAAFGVAVLTMALALGANTIVFSALKTFLFAKIAVPDPERLFMLASVRHGTAFSDAYPNYDLIRRTQRTFADVTCTMQVVASWDDHGESRALQMSRVTASFFPTMRVFPTVGRAFAEREEGSQAARVVVISYGLWQAAMAGDPKILGATMRLDGEPYTVIGVMPEGFTQPVPTDVWVPLDAPPADRVAITGARHYTVYGRLDQSRPLTATVAEMKGITERTVAASADNRDFGYEARPVREVLLDGADSTAIVVQEGAVVLLLLAVLNLASLFISWGFERRQELAVRRTLGAGGGHVIRILLMQSLVVVGTGAAIGIGLTYLAVPWLRGLHVGTRLTYFTSRIVLDGGVLAVSATVAVLAGLVAGVLPAWFSRKHDLAQSLRSGTRSATLSPAALRWQQGMIVIQAALSVMILAAAALLGMSFRNLQRVPAGFAVHGAIGARLELAPSRYPDSTSRATLGRSLIDNLSHEPALAAAALSSTLPIGDTPWVTFFYIPLSDGGLSKEPVLFNIRRTSPNYLSTMKIPLLSGRQFDLHDDDTRQHVAIVSRSLVKRVWADESPLGKRIYRVVPGSTVPSALTVVGVAENVSDAGTSVPPSETVYLPWAQLSTPRMSIVVRPRGSDEAAITAIRHALRVTDPVLAAHDVMTLDASVDQANALARLRSVLLLAFAAAAIAMATLGCYGVMSQLVATREREYSIRLVFGASPAEMGRSVLGQVARLTVPGVALGLLAMLFLAGTLKRFVFGVDPRSAVVFSAVGLGMLAIGIASALPSAIRAMRVDVRRSIAS